MKHLLLTTAAVFGLSTAAGAHGVWIERDGTGPARIYLGEPAEALPEGGDPEFAKLVAPKLLSSAKGAMTRRAGFLEVAVAPGDVRAWDDNVFQTWGTDGKKEGVVYYARAGRAEPRAVMPVEIAPLTKNGNRFQVVRNGKPVPNAELTIVSPRKQTQTMVTDAYGAVTIPEGERGRYLLTTTIRDDGPHSTPAGPVTILPRIATTTFVR